MNAPTLTRIAGLRFSSDFDLAGAPCDPGDIDIVVGRARVADPLPDAVAVAALLKVSPGGAVNLDIPGIARFRIEAGQRIDVEPANDGVPAQDIRTFLLGTALGAALHQRGILPLHASTVSIGGRAVAIAGASGAGKSTLAHALNRRGHPLVADDISPICFDADGMPYVLPLLPHVKLWGDALAAAQGDTGNLEPVRNGIDKYRVPLAQVAADRVPLHALVLLIDGGVDGECATRVRGMAAVKTVRSQIYRLAMGEVLRGPSGLFADAARLSGRIAVVELARRKGFARLDHLMKAVEALTEPR